MSTNQTISKKTKSAYVMSGQANLDALNVGDRASWRTRWALFKWKDPDDKLATLLRKGVSLDLLRRLYPKQFIGSEVIDGNLALNEGLQEAIDLICGLGSPTAFSNANACIGVGDNSTTAYATQPGLQATTNKLYKGMDSGYPQRSGQTVTFQATFGPNDANFSWQEFTVANGSSDTAKNLNRKVQDKGTKASGETWVIQVSITFS